MKLGPYLLGPNETPENGIYTGDAMELAESIPDESVDLIFTDPVYREIDHYRWLAKMAARVLKQDTACLAWYGGPAIAAVQSAMADYLRWTWQLNYTVPAKPNKLIGYNIFTWTTPCLWYRKGKGFPKQRIPDTFISTARPATAFKWNKNPAVIRRWCAAFTDEAAIILDPFSGSGTLPAACKQLGRHCLAFEIDPVTAELARERVRNTQPPLFIPDAAAEQFVLDISEAQDKGER